MAATIDFDLSAEDLMLLAQESRMEALVNDVRQAAMQQQPHPSLPTASQQPPRPPLATVATNRPANRPKLGASPKRMDDHRVPLWNSRLQRRQEGQCAPKRK